MRLILPCNWDTEIFHLLDGLRVDSLIGALGCDPVGGSIPSYRRTPVEKKEADSFIANCHCRGIRFIYDNSAPSAGNYEFRRDGDRSLRRHLDWLLEVQVDRVLVASPYLAEMILRHAPGIGVIVRGVASLADALLWIERGVDYLVIDPFLNRDLKKLESIRRRVNATLSLELNPLHAWSSANQGYAANAYGQASQSINGQEGFLLDYPLLNTMRQLLSVPETYLRIPLIRPEDLHLYEALGINSFHVLDQSMSTPWIIKTARAYQERKSNDNLLELLPLPLSGSGAVAESGAGSGADTALPFNLMILDRPDHGNGQITTSQEDVRAFPLASLSSKDAAGLAGLDLDSEESAIKLARMVNLLELPSSGKRHKCLQKLTNLMNAFLSGQAFDLDPRYPRQPLVWESGLEEIFLQSIQKKPFFARDLAAGGIRQRAEEYALERGSRMVQLQDFVRAALILTPEPFRCITRNHLAELGISLPEEDQPVPQKGPARPAGPVPAPAAKTTVAVQTAITNPEMIPLRNQEDCERLVSALADRVNKDRQAMGSLPKTRMKINFILEDIDASYSEVMDEGSFQVIMGRAADADIWLTMSGTTWKQLMWGSIHPMQAAQKGLIKPEGPVFKLIKTHRLLTNINRLFPDAAQAAACSPDTASSSPARAGSSSPDRDNGSGNGSGAVPAPPATAGTVTAADKAAAADGDFPVRDTASLEKLVRALKDKINGDENALESLPPGRTTVAYVLSDLGLAYTEIIEDRRYEIEMGHRQDAEVVLRTDSRTWYEIMAGIIHPMQAAQQKRSQPEGPIFKLIRMQRLLNSINRLFPLAVEEAKNNQQTAAQESSQPAAAEDLGKPAADCASVPEAAISDEAMLDELIHRLAGDINDDHEALQALPAERIVVQYLIEDLNTAYAERIGDGRFQVEMGEVADAPVRIRLSSRTWHDLMRGDLHPMQATQKGLMQIEGPVFNLIKLQRFLKYINQFYPRVYAGLRAGLRAGGTSSADGPAEEPQERKEQTMDWHPETKKKLDSIMESVIPEMFRPVALEGIQTGATNSARGRGAQVIEDADLAFAFQGAPRMVQSALYDELGKMGVDVSDYKAKLAQEDEEEDEE
ncbi:MAG: SCP2 sterol-binding domain-containing protein [bacterium]